MMQRERKWKGVRRKYRLGMDQHGAVMKKMRAEEETVKSGSSGKGLLTSAVGGTGIQMRP